MALVRLGRAMAPWVVAGLIGAGAAASALAQGSALSWHCWVDGGERLNCVLDALPATDSGLPASIPPPAAGATDASAGAGAGTSAAAAAAARRLPPIVARLRDRPRTLAGQVIVIPMHSVTDDWPRVTQLARAVLCTADASCVIRLSTSLNEALGRGLDTDRLFIGPDLGPLGLAPIR